MNTVVSEWEDFYMEFDTETGEHVVYNFGVEVYRHKDFWRADIQLARLAGF